MKFYHSLLDSFLTLDPLWVSIGFIVGGWPLLGFGWYFDNFWLAVSSLPSFVIGLIILLVEVQREEKRYNVRG